MKSLAEIAYREFSRNCVRAELWEDLTDGQRERWARVAETIAEQVLNEGAASPTLAEQLAEQRECDEAGTI